MCFALNEAVLGSVQRRTAGHATGEQLASAVERNARNLVIAIVRLPIS